MLFSEDRSEKQTTRRHLTAAVNRAVAQTLESRTLLSTAVWTGNVDNSWAEAGNWSAGVAPGDGSDILFPAGPGNRTVVNDHVSSLGSIAIFDSYDLSGSAIAIDNGIDDVYADGDSTISAPIELSFWQFISKSNASGTNHKLTLTGGISDGGNGYGLTIGGGGVVSIANSPATYTGATNVSGTTLSLENTSIDSDVTVTTAGTFTGNGTTAALALHSGSSVAPGVSGTGVLHTGDLSFESTAAASFDINGTTVGSGYDQLDVAGTVTLGGSTLSVSLGFTPAEGSQFTLIKNDGTDAVSGTFSGLAEGALFNVSGDAFRISYTGGSGNDVVLTRLVTPTVVLTGATTPLVFGESRNFSVAVAGSAGTPAGSVTLMDGSTVLDTQTIDGLGNATFSVSDIAVGSHSLSAAYAGEGTYADQTSNSVAITVSKADALVAIGVSDASTVFGDSVTFTATATPVTPSAATPAGDVEFFDGSFSLGIASLDNTGVATLTLSDLPTGSHTVAGVYTGSTSFNGGNSSSSAAIAVSQDSSSTAVIAVSQTTLFSDTAEFQANVISAGGGAATGNVEFFDGATSLGLIGVDAYGGAVLDITTLTIGQHTISAVYSGDANVAGSGAPTPAVVEITNNAPTTIGLSDVDVNQDAPNTTMGLTLAFADIEDQDTDLVYTVSGNTNTHLITPTISDQTLTLAYAPGAFGSGNITIRATDTYNDFVETTFAVSVAHVPANGAIQFASPTASISEAAGTVNLIVSRIGGSEGVVSAHYAVSGGTATPDDYTLAAGTLTFAEGEISKSISVTVNDDAIDESDETLTVQLSAPTNGAAIGATDSTTLTITDNIAPTTGDFTVTHLPGGGSAFAPIALGAASDPDADALTISIVTGPSYGTASIDDRGTLDPSDDQISYTSNPANYLDDCLVYGVSDGHGHIATATAHLTNVGGALVPSAITPGLFDLVVIGTSGDDDIEIYPYKVKKETKVTVNDVSYGHYLVTGRVIAFGGDGNDTIQARYIKQAVIFSGGAGNDRLTGATGQDILVGGEGDDRLKGLDKRDLMIGGNGADRIDGAAPDDIIIGGASAYDALGTTDQLKLIDIVNVWNGPGKRTARQNRIAAGVGASLGALNNTTVFSDNSIDDLGKQTSKNWIFDDTFGNGVTADLVRGRRAA